MREFVNGRKGGRDCGRSVPSESEKRERQVSQRSRRLRKRKNNKG